MDVYILYLISETQQNRDGIYFKELCPIIMSDRFLNIKSRPGAYSAINRLEREGLIKIVRIKKIPPENIIKITEEGLKNLELFFKVIRNGNIMSRNSKKEVKQKESMNQKMKNHKKTELIGYYGTPLVKNNADVLIELEKMLEIPVPIIKDYNIIKNNQRYSYPFGYAQEHNHVTVLSLKYNIKAKKLKNLPENIGNLNNLFFLEISGNFITEFPESLTELTKLEELSIISHKFRLDLNDLKPVEIPECIQYFTKLKKLSISFDNIAEIPPWLGEITSLEYLSLSDFPQFSQPKKLPKTFANLVNLRELSLSCNIVSPLPEIFSSLTNLQKLNLSGNQLASLPDSIRFLTRLEYLGLSDNKITILPEFMKNFDDPSYNHFTGISIEKNPLRSLSNIPKKVFSKILKDLKNSDDTPLINTGKALFHKCYDFGYNSMGYLDDEIEKLYEFYKKSTVQIAQQYATDPNSLTPDEKERLAWEAGYSERNLLENSPKIPLDDPIIHKITQRISFGDDVLSTTPKNSSRTLHGTALSELPRVLHQINKYYEEGVPEAAPQLPSHIMNTIREFHPSDGEMETKYRSGIILAHLENSRNIYDMLLWEVYQYYKKSLHSLVQQYIKDKKLLNINERQRLAWEAKKNEFDILSRSLPPEDKVLIEIRKRLFPKKPKIKLLR